MTVLTKDDLIEALQVAGLTEKVSLLGMHLSEIESEADTILDLLIVLRAHAHREDANATQETLAELSVALEHLVHHAQESLPEIEKRLEIAP